jgi:transcription antitermination factor NusG
MLSEREIPLLPLERNAASERANLPWFALSVKSRYERVAATFLENSGYELFLPMYKSRRFWSDRIKELDVPLFPGYLFCRFDIYNRLPVLVTPGVLGIVGGTKLPTPIDVGEISSLQTAVQAGMSREPWPFLNVGDRVRITRGSLAGVEGILMQVKGRHRLILSVTLLQRSIAVDIDSAWVSSLASYPRRPQSLGLVRTAPSQATA